MTSDTIDRAEATKLMKRLCALVGNCELGAAQRFWGAEPLDLFRWGAPTTEMVIRMLRDRLSAIADPRYLRVSEASETNAEYMIDHSFYRFRWHTWTNKGRMSAEKVLARQLVSLPWLASKLMEELTDASRIFVMKQDATMDASKAARELHDAMRTFGAPTLLWVTDGAAVAIHRTNDALFHGTLPQFSDPARVFGTTDNEAWLELARLAAATLEG